MKGFIRLKPDDHLFLIGSTPYALIPSKQGWRAAEVVKRGRNFFRSETHAPIARGTIDGVIHQQEWFAAAKLDRYLNAGAHHVIDEIERASRDVAQINRRIRRRLTRLGFAT
jgi:hypothetical protein